MQPEATPVATNTAIHPRVAVHGISSRGWTLDQDLDFYRVAGIRTLGIPSRKMPADSAAADAAVARVRASGLALSCYVAENPGGDYLSEEHAPASVTQLLAGLDTAAALGAPCCYFLTGRTAGRLPPDEALRRFAAYLRPAQQRARERGVRLAFEHNATGRAEFGFVHSLQDAVQVAQATGLDICVEVQNCWTELNLGRLLREHTAHFAMVQVSDFVVGTTTPLTRAVPGDGDVPLEWMLGELLEGGYPGLFEIELLGPRIEAEGYASAITRSVQWLSSRLWQWGVK